MAERSTRGTGVITSFTNATGSNLADLGRVRRVPPITTRRELPAGDGHRAPAGHGERLRRTRGEAAGTQPGSSSAERTTVNTGTARPRVPAAGIRPAVRDRRTDR